jgi:TonB family protein
MMKKQRLQFYIILSLLAHLIITIVIMIIEHKKMLVMPLPTTSKSNQKDQRDSTVIIPLELIPFQSPNPSYKLPASPSAQEQESDLEQQPSHDEVAPPPPQSEKPSSPSSEPEAEQKHSTQPSSQLPHRHDHKHLPTFEHPLEKKETPSTSLLSENHIQEPYEKNPPKKDLLKDVVTKNDPVSYSSPSFNKQNQAPSLQASSPQPLQTRRSIIAMTAGYLKSLSTQGNSIQEQHGEKRMPTFEELRYLSYQQKIDEALMSSWRIVSRSRCYRDQTQPPKASVAFEINKDGSLAFVSLVTSSGDRNFDHLVLLAIQKAAPFPPIPDHLKIDRYRPQGGVYYVE